MERTEQLHEIHQKLDFGKLKVGRTEPKITGGHWPFPKMANQIHIDIKKWPTNINFFFACSVMNVFLNVCVCACTCLAGDQYFHSLTV